MPLEIPERRGVWRSLQTYVRSDLPELDPTPDRRSKIGAWVKSVGSGLHDWYVTLKDYADKQPFPQTATGAFLTQGWWRDITKLDPIPASASQGVVLIRGALGTNIPQGAELTASGTTYRTIGPATVLQQIVVLDTLTYDTPSDRYVATTIEPHNLATGLDVFIHDSSQPNYSGKYTIIVTSETDFVFKVKIGPVVAPSAGGPVLSSQSGPRAYSAFAIATVTAASVGARTNVSGGGQLTMSQAIPGVTGAVLATFGGVSGGAEAETQASYRTRILKALGTDFGAFTSDEIEIVAKQVPGVTRVWIKKATRDGTNGVLEGQVVIAFVRDNDGTRFPSSQEVAAVKNLIVETCMTCNTAPEDVIVKSPTPLPISFNLRITPSTISMQNAVASALRQYFLETASYEQAIELIDIRCAIKDIIDPSTRVRLKSLEVLEPISTIVVGENQLPTLGGVTFSEMGGGY
jgi:uncharacterized phage protein gp47/JayE